MTGTEIFGLYRRVLLRAWPAALLLALLTSFLVDRLMLQLPDPLDPEALERLLAFLGSANLWRSLLALSLLSLWPGCALVLCAHKLVGGVALPAAGGLVAALRAYPAALMVALAYAALAAAGLLLLLIPGLYLAGALQLWVVALMAGDASASQSLQSSWRRVRGHWWRSNSMVAVVVVCGLGAGALVSVCASTAVHALTAAWPLDAPAQRIAALAVSIVVNFVTAPAYPVALVASYRDLGAPTQ